MSRVNLGLITATFASLLAIDTAAASCWLPFGSCGGCCAQQSYVYAPQPVYVQQAPQIVQVMPPPVVVQVAQPQVIVQQEPPQMYVVNQGPHYAGPNLTDYSQPLYYPSRPARAYPYVNGYNGAGYNGGYNGAGYNGGYNGAVYNGGYRVYNGGYRRPYVRPYMRPYARPYAHGARPYYHARYRGPVRRHY